MTNPANHDFWVTREADLAALERLRKNPATLSLVEPKIRARQGKTQPIPIRCGQRPAEPYAALRFGIRNNVVELWADDGQELWLLTGDDTDALPVEFSCHCTGSHKPRNVTVATLFERGVKAVATGKYRAIDLH